MTQIDKELKLESYFFELPKERIAARPAKRRHDSKLLVYDVLSNKTTHTTFLNLDRFLPDESLIVFNQSKVFPCRLLGKKSSGGKAEIFILDPEISDKTYKALVKTTSKKLIGDKFYFDFNITATIDKLFSDGTFGIRFNEKLDYVLGKIGKMPIPPYIRGGEADNQDLVDYQTIYAKEVGSVAAPTAGLHFTPEVFEKLNKKNINKAFVTLHVGLGTFAPVKSESITDHKMHEEVYLVDKPNLELINRSKFRIAVGTTSLRVLESANNTSLNQLDIIPGDYMKTDIFLHPGKHVSSIQALITNFHLPKSTLLMLVSSIVGREKTLELYQEAIDNKYRFFSYGDAMLIIL